MQVQQGGSDPRRVHCRQIPVAFHVTVASCDPRRSARGFWRRLRAAPVIEETPFASPEPGTRRPGRFLVEVYHLCEQPIAFLRESHGLFARLGALRLGK